MIALLKDVRMPFSVLLLAYAMLLNVNLLLYPPEIRFTATAPLTQLVLTLLETLSGNNPSFLAILFTGMVWVQALLINAICNSQRLFETVSGLPALFYILLIGLFNQHLYLSPPFFATFAIIYTLAIIYESYNSDSFTHYFDAGFVISIASLFYLPALLLLIFVFIGITITRVIRWRQWVVVLLGVFTPYLLIGTWYFWRDEFGSFFVGHFFHISTSVVTEQFIAGQWIVQIGVFAGLALISFFITQQRIQFSVVKIKKMTTILGYLLLISTLTFAFVERYTLAPMAFVAVPMSVYMAYWFQGIRKFIFAEFLHILLLGMTFYFQYAKYIL